MYPKATGHIAKIVPNIQGGQSVQKYAKMCQTSKEAKVNKTTVPI